MFYKMLYGCLKLRGNVLGMGRIPPIHSSVIGKVNGAVYLPESVSVGMLSLGPRNLGCSLST